MRRKGPALFEQCEAIRLRNEITNRSRQKLMLMNERSALRKIVDVGRSITGSIK